MNRNWLTPEFKKNFPWSVWWILPEETKLRLQRLWYPHIVVGGYVWPAVFIIGALFFTNFTGNPLMWITFNQVKFTLALGGFKMNFGSLFTTDHFWDLLIIAGLSISLAFYLRKQTGKKLATLGVISTWGCWLMWTQHEGIWWVTNTFFDPKGYLLFFGPGALLTFFTIFIFYQFGYFPWRSLIAIAGYYVVWAALGFHVTVNTEGPTPYFTDPATFETEIGSWAYGAVAFWTLERHRLVDWYLKVVQTMYQVKVN